MDKLQIKVIYDENLALFFNFDHTLYLTLKCHKLSEFTEEKLALLICHEMSHFLLGHNSRRIIISYFHWDLYKKWFKTGHEKEFSDPRLDELKERTKIQKYSCFYPQQQKFFDKFYEKNCDILAVQLWKETYLNESNQELLENHS